MARPNQRLPTVTLYADKKEVQSAFDKASKTLVCHKCGQPFSLLFSMGALECRQHPGYVQENGIWSCCGKKQMSARWSKSWEITRMYNSKEHYMPYKPIPSVTGCQKCDHNTSDQPFTHKDAQSIAELSAILPFMNKAMAFNLREGFDQGVLRRCECQPIPVPALAYIIQYMDIGGDIKFYDPKKKTRFTFDDQQERIEEEQLDNNHPRGIILAVYDKQLNTIDNWH